MKDTFDFMALGQAIKKAREAKGMTREQLAEILGVAPRHLQSIENEGQYPSFPLFARLVTMFNISADQYLFTEGQAEKTSLRRQIDSILHTLADHHLISMDGTAKGTRRAKDARESSVGSFTLYRCVFFCSVGNNRKYQS